jgi:spore coat protein U-like protein
LILSAGVGSIGAQNVKYVTLSPKSIRANYDSTLEAATTVTATLSIDKGSTELDYYVSFDPSPSGRFVTNASASLPYEIYDSAIAPRTVLLDVVSATSPDSLLTGVFPVPAKNKAPTANRSFALVVMPGGFAPAGTYTGSVVVTLWSGPFKSGTYMGEALMDLTVTVRDILDVVLVPVDAPFNFSATNVMMDFGFLTAGDQRSLDLIARANTTYGLSLSSANGGFLKNTDVLDTSTIGYELLVNGSPLVLAAGANVALASGAAATSASGVRYRLDTRILPFDFPSEGTYTDILTVTISKN